MRLLIVNCLALWSIVASGCSNSAPNQVPPPTISVSVLTWHNDIRRSGVNSQETILTTLNVRTATFGKRFSCSVDADVYAQPLYVPGVSITGNGTHNVVFVATEKNSLYALDADASPCSVLWQKSLMNSGETFVSDADVVCSQAISPNIGITGTPVIDAASQTLYVVSTSKSSTALIQASVSGTGAASSGGTVSFDPKWHLQRPGLLLLGGTVYVAWASYCDNDPYHGWVLSFSAGSGTLQKVSTLNDTPNGTRGGIWMSGAGPASDGTNIFLITGNGTFDANASGSDFGDSFLKLSSSLSVGDWFTPSNEGSLESNDLDVGGGGAVLLIDNPGGSLPHLLIGGGKEGKLYLLNRDSLGHFASNDSQVVQSFSLSSNGIYATPVFWQGTLYIAAADSHLAAFAFNTTGQFNPNPTSQSSAIFGFPGATPSVSSNGTTSGIVWAIERSAAGAAVLHAYDATNLANELWNSSMAAGSRDQAGGAVKFTVPTVVNGKVYVGTHLELDVFGLLP